MSEKAPALVDPPEGYGEWFVDLKSRIRVARQRAARAVNSELLTLYWGVGRDILERQERQGWGARVIDRLAHDLREAFPDAKGYSPRNLKYMRAFAAAWPGVEIVQGPLAQLTWYHQIALLEKLDSPDERLAYAHAAVEHGWSRDTLVLHISARTVERTGRAITNFASTLPTHTSDLARDSLKDPYKLDFLGLGDGAQERAIEQALVDHVAQFLVELGAGFAYVGRQVPLPVGSKDFYLDLLFYHLKLRCYVVIELKAGDFKPDYVGQLSFYLAAVDAEVKHPEDGPTIGLLLCKTKDSVVAEYALRNVAAPLGVSEYELLKDLPEPLATNLPTIEQIEAELAATTPHDDTLEGEQ